MTEILAAPSFICHKTSGRSQRKLQCAGHMILRGKENAFVAVAAALSEKITLTGRHLVFESEAAAIKHHSINMQTPSQTVQDIINDCTVDGLHVKLPEGQLDRDIYVQVAKKLNDIGGAWKGGKIAAFVFSHDPAPLLERIQSGEKVNLKKEYQFFETPDALADTMAARLMAVPGHFILEPSAGRGALIRAVHRVIPGAVITAYELMPENQAFLRIPKVVVAGYDFLQTTDEDMFHRIIANPPFSKNQDIDHIYRMFQVLRPGGRLVTLASNHWRISKNGKEREFQAFLDRVNADIEDVPAGTFAESGTQVSACMITIDKPVEWDNAMAELEERILNK